MIDEDCSKATPEQMKVVLEQIATMAGSLKELCFEIGVHESNGCKPWAAAAMAEKIGWLADRCIGFETRSSDDWLLPSSWDRAVKVDAEPA